MRDESGTDVMKRETITESDAGLIGPAGTSILSCRLMKQGGYAVFEGLAAPTTQRALLRESVRLAPTAAFNSVRDTDFEEARGGKPCRKLLSASGGPVQDGFYHATYVKEFLEEVVQLPILPTGSRGTYSYYARPGDYLGLHRDIETCDVAVNTCLFDGASRDAQGGVLALYPERIFEPLAHVDSTPDQGIVRIRLLPGQTIVMIGGAIPHAVEPVGPGEVRIVSVLCFRV